MIPLSLKLKNFFSHADSEIDFSQFQSVLLIGNTEGDYGKSNGSGKCLSGDTILTEAFSGEKITVKDLHENFKEFWIWGLDEDLLMRPVEVEATHLSGEKDILEVEMTSGGIERVSRTHPVMISDTECIPAEDLIVGDFVASPRALPVVNPRSSMRIEEARLLGLYAAEGGLTGTSCNFTNTDDEIISIAHNDVQSIFGADLSRRGITYSLVITKNIKDIRRQILDRMIQIGLSLKKESPSNHKRIESLSSTLCYDKLISYDDSNLTSLAKVANSPRTAREFLSKHALWGSLAINKRVPRAIFSESEENVGAFVGMFFSGDGYVSSSDSSSPEVSIGLGSKGFVYDLQELFLRFGIKASIRYKRVADKYDSWVLSIHSNYNNILKFYNLVDGHVYGPKRSRIDTLIASSRKRKANPNRDVIPSSLFCGEIIEGIESGGLRGHRSELRLTKRQLSQSNMSRERLGKYADALGSNRLRSLSESDIYWDKIKRIDSIGKAQTYDIQVGNDTHLYALNGFITHNSSIFESMLWVLFNKARSAMMDDIVLWGETSCCVEFEFQHNNRVYRVIRERNRGSSTSTVELAQKDDTGAWKDLSGSTSGATNSSIEELIGLDHKTFTSSIYFRQNDISEFAEADPSRKKDILKSIVDISRWDSYEKEAKKKARLLKSETDILEAAVSTYAETVEDLGDASAELKEVTTIVANAKKELSATNKHLEGLVSQYSNMKKALDTDKYDKILESIAALEEREADLSGDANELSQQVEDKTDEVDAEQKKIEEKRASLSQLSKVESCDDKLSELREELISLSSSGSSAKDALGSLSEIHITPGECYVCHQAIESSLYESLRDDHKEKSDRYSESMTRAASKIRIVKKSISDYEGYKKENLRIDTLEKELSSFEFRHSILSEGLEREKKKLIELKRVLGNVSSKLSVNKDILKSLQNSDFQVLRDKVKDLKDRREDLDSIISGNSEDVGRLTERVSQLEQSVKDMRGKKTSLSSKLKDISLFKSMSKMMGKNGIQTILLDGIIEDLESSSNKILSSICNEPSTITLETQRTGSDGVSTVETLDLKVKKDGVLHGFKSLSGGEKFRISLSLRVALSDLSSRYGGSSLEFLLLDEVNSPLDRFGVETLFVSVIRALEAQYKIMVITHDETLKEKFDHVIDVTKVNGKSSIDFLAR